MVGYLQRLEDVIVGARREISRRSLSSETAAASNRVGRREDDGELVHHSSTRLSQGKTLSLIIVNYYHYYCVLYL